VYLLYGKFIPFTLEYISVPNHNYCNNAVVKIKKNPKQTKKTQPKPQTNKQPPPPKKTQNKPQTWANSLVCGLQDLIKP